LGIGIGTGCLLMSVVSSGAVDEVLMSPEMQTLRQSAKELGTHVAQLEQKSKATAERADAKAAEAEAQAEKAETMAGMALSEAAWAEAQVQEGMAMMEGEALQLQEVVFATEALSFQHESLRAQVDKLGQKGEQAQDGRSKPKTDSPKRKKRSCRASCRSTYKKCVKKARLRLKMARGGISQSEMFRLMGAERDCEPKLDLCLKLCP